MSHWNFSKLGGTQIRTGDKGFAGPGLTTWLCHQLWKQISLMKWVYSSQGT